MAAQGRICVHRQDPIVVYRVEGRATLVQSHGFRRDAEQAIAGGARELHIDLSDCTYFDSTFLGTLLLLHRTCARRPGAAVSLVKPSVACERLLGEMGVAELFPRCATATLTPACPWEDLSGQAADPSIMKGNVVQAHVELASLPGPAGEAFRSVARCLTEAQKAEQKSL